MTNTRKPDQRHLLAALAEKHPNMRVSTLREKLAAEIKVNQLRDEIGWKQDRTPAQVEMLAGLEWL